MQRVNTKERIREAALELFQKQGFAKTSIARIESAAGLAPRAGTFYRHFESKEALLEDISLSFLTETPEEFGFENLGLMGNTRAELIAIALKYEEAAERQKPFLKLFDEVRAFEFGAGLEQKANEAMMEGLTGWLEGKPAAKGLDRKQCAALALNVFGPWLFFLTKSQHDIAIKTLDRKTFLSEWATFWAQQLDEETSK